jgi:predicted phage tail protein
MEDPQVKKYFSRKIGKQTITGALVILAFPFVYLGSQQHSNALIIIGMSMIFAGVIAAPCITFADQYRRSRQKSD